LHEPLDPLLGKAELLGVYIGDIHIPALDRGSPVTLGELDRGKWAGVSHSTFFGRAADGPTGGPLEKSVVSLAMIFTAPP